MGPRAKLIWMDGEFRPWDEARVHVMTHTLHYGFGVFEGIRCYKTSEGPAVFRLREHVDRLFDSAKAALIEIPFTKPQIFDACLEAVRTNGLDDCYIRPLVFYADGEMGLGAINPVRVSIAAFPWGAYLGKEGLEKGIRATVSSYNRLHLSSNMLHAKICGQYTTSVIAKRLAVRNGYQEAIFLDGQGYCTEGTGENLFILKNGVLKTPPDRAAILPGVTRDSILTIARDHADELKLTVREESFARDELLLADEVFLTGTAAECTPVREIDGRSIGAGARGPVTEHLQSCYFRTVRGQEPSYRHWLAPVPAR